MGGFEMDDFKERLIHLLHYPGVTWTTIYQILKKDPALSSIDHIGQNALRQNAQFPPLNSFQHPASDHSFEFIHEQIHQYETNQIQVISFFDKEYPAN
jgi:DNA processing protein